MKKVLSLLLALTMTLSLAACGSSAPTPATPASQAPASQAPAESKPANDYKIELKMSHVFAPQEQLTKSLDEVVKNIEQRTNGAVKIVQFPQGQLATYKDGVEQVVQGANFISVEDPTYLGDYNGDFNALSAPFLYSNFDQYNAVVNSDVVAKMKKDVESKGIKVLSLGYIFGFRSLMTNKDNITTPADIKGMKLRVPGSQLFIDTFTALGAVPTPMPFGETIAAVQQGVVDGLEGTMDAYGSNGSAEVAKKMALTNHILGVCGVYVNIDIWNAMPEEYQKIVQEEFDKGAQKMTETVSSNYASQKKALEEKGCVFNEVDHAAFASLVEPVWKSMKVKTPDIFDQFKAVIATVK